MPMFERILIEIKERIRARKYVMTVHAEEEMEGDGLSILDVENAILNGQIVERQKDHDTGEWKYLVEGNTRGTTLIAVSKISITGKVVILTVFVL